MPTVFYYKGYRFFFYSNENNEPVHIHVEKAEASAKFWLEPGIEEVYSYGLNSKERKEIRGVIERRYNDIIDSWNDHFGSEKNISELPV